MDSADHSGGRDGEAGILPGPALPAILGRCMLSNGEEFVCEAIDASSRAMTIVAKRRVPIHEPVVCYLNQIGVVHGLVSHCVANGFVIELDVSADRRSQIAARLEWQATRTSEQRAAPRIVPIHRAVEVRLGDAALLQGVICDISLTGAAITLAEPIDPVIGSIIRVGKRYATVVRLLTDGIAVQFKLPFVPETFSPYVVL